MSGGGAKQTIGFKYYLGLHAVFCHGPVDDVTRITFDDKEAWAGSAAEFPGGRITVDAPELFGGQSREGGVGGAVDVLFGGPTQGLNDYLVSVLGANLLPAYRGVLSLIFNKFYFGNNPYFKKMGIRAIRTNIRTDGTPQWYIEKARIGRDMNPAHIVRECLIDQEWGMGQADVDMGASFTTCADILHNEGFGLSFAWVKEKDVEEVIDLILKHIDGSVYVDRFTGKFEMVLARGGYDVSALPVLDENSIDKVSEYRKNTVSELTNQITVIYWDKSISKNNSTTVQDIALQIQQGTTIGATIQYPAITRGDLAARVAARQLKVMSSPLASVSLHVNRNAVILNIGSVFVVNWAELNISGVVFRVTDIDLGTLKRGRVTVNAVEDYFSLSDAVYSPPPATVWTDPIGPPLPVPYRFVCQAPYYLVARWLGDTSASQLSANAAYIMLAGSYPGNGAYLAKAMVAEGGAAFPYTEVGQVSFVGTATIAADYGPGDTVLAITGGQDLDLAKPGDIGCFGYGSIYMHSTEHEFFQLETISSTSITVKRGMLDTPPLRVLPSGMRIMFLGDYVTGIETQYQSNDVLGVKMLTVTGKGTLDAVSAPNDAISMTARMAAPNPPGKLQVNGVSYPTVAITRYPVITWKHRDKSLQTGPILVDQFADDIGPEPGTTYAAVLRDGVTDVILQSDYNISSNSITYLEGLIKDKTSLRFQLGTHLGSYYSRLHDFTFPSNIVDGPDLYVGGTYSNNLSASPSMLAVPAGTTTGDLMILIMHGRADRSFILNAGWTVLHNRTLPASGASPANLFSRAVILSKAYAGEATVSVEQSVELGYSAALIVVRGSLSTTPLQALTDGRTVTYTRNENSSDSMVLTVMLEAQTNKSTPHVWNDSNLQRGRARYDGMLLSPPVTAYYYDIVVATRRLGGAGASYTIAPTTGGVGNAAIWRAEIT